MKVLIVGAGIAGLALAARLLRDGHSPRVIECRPANDERYGAGLLLTPNAMLALSTILPTDSWQAALRKVTRVTIADANDESLFDVLCTDGWPAPFATMRHHRLRSLLLAPTQGFVQNEISISQLDADDGSVVLSDGSTDQFDLIVGADGVHSSVRTQLFGPNHAGTAAPFEGFRCVTRNTAKVAEPRQLIGNGATLLLYPLPDDDLYIGAGPIDPHVLVDHADPATSIRETFAGYGPSAAEALADLPGPEAFIPTRYWTVRQRQWSRGRCALIGDAAHASPPTLAQGAAMALEDADVLATMLAAHTDVPSALRAYEVRRRPRVERVQSESIERLSANHLMTPHAARVRDQIARRVGGQSLEDTWKWLANERP